jgi:LL-diaminopimelate aminotransferase
MLKDIKISQRMGNLPKNNFSVVAQLKRKLLLEGSEFIDLSAGITDLKPDHTILTKLAAYSLRPDLHTYSVKFDIVELHHALQNFFLSEFNVPIKTLACLTTLGSKEAISHIHSALIDKNDVVLVPELHYPFYSLSARYYKAEVYAYELDEQYMPVLHNIPKHILDRAKILWINYPHNPTGATADDATIQSVVEFCKQHNIFLCADMAYSHINFFTERSASILKYYPQYNNMIEIHTVSKNFSIPGWRLGFALGNPEVIEVIAESKSLFDTGAFMVTQKAAAYAIENHKNIIPTVRKEYKSRSLYMYKKLSELGYSVFRAKGTYFLWIKVPNNHTGTSYAQYLLEKKKILLLDGAMFGPKGKEFVRLALTEPVDILEKVADKLGESFKDN